MNRIAKLLSLLALLSVACVTRATDIPINPSGPIFKIPGIQAWGVAGAGGFNNNFLFTPIYNSESVCVYVFNNNPLNAHTFTGQILVTGDPTSSSTASIWQFAGINTNLSVSSSPSSPITFSAQISGVAQAAVSLGSSITQAGSPDTATIIIAQTTGSCFSGIGVFTSNTITQSVTSPLQAISEGFNFAFTASNTVTNPASGQLIHLINNTAPSIRNTFFDRVSITSTAAATVNLLITTNSGTTCSLGSISINLKIGSGNGPVSTTVIGTCVANPAGSIFLANVPVTTAAPTVIDLKGIIAGGGSSGGVDVVMAAALTGTISTSFFWYEK